jgi:hypothetical protein
MKLGIGVLVVIASLAIILAVRRKPSTTILPAQTSMLSGVVVDEAHPGEHATVQVGLIEFGSEADRLHNALWEQCIASSDPDCFQKAASQTLSSGMAGLALTEPDASGHFALKPPAGESYLVVSGRDAEGWLWCPSEDISGSFEEPDKQTVNIRCQSSAELPSPSTKN